MLRHMRTTMIINDELYRQVKERARADQMTVTALVEEALRSRLADAGRRTGPVDVHLAPPTGTPGGRPLVDVTDKDVIYDLLDEGGFTVQQTLAGRADGR